MINLKMLLKAVENIPQPTSAVETIKLIVEDRMYHHNRCVASNPPATAATFMTVTLVSIEYRHGSRVWYEWSIDL